MAAVQNVRDLLGAFAGTNELEDFALAWRQTLMCWLQDRAQAVQCIERITLVDQGMD